MSKTVIYPGGDGVPQGRREIVRSSPSATCRAVRKAVTRVFGLLTFGHPYNKRLPTVIPISDLLEVSMYDQRRPERVCLCGNQNFTARSR